MVHFIIACAYLSMCQTKTLYVKLKLFLHGVITLKATERVEKPISKMIMSLFITLSPIVQCEIGTNLREYCWEEIISNL